MTSKLFSELGLSPKRRLSRKRQKPVEPLPIVFKAFKARFLTRSPNKK
jgi:hypothetical protein